MGTVAGNKPERIEDLFVAYDVDVGVYGVRFNVVSTHRSPPLPTRPPSTTQTWGGRFIFARLNPLPISGGASAVDRTPYGSLLQHKHVAEGSFCILHVFEGPGYGLHVGMILRSP